VGGQSARKRSSFLINDDFLIDLGPDVTTAAAECGVDLTQVQYCLITHAHSDHFDASHLSTRDPGYRAIDMPRLSLYASPASLRVMSEMLKRECETADLFDPVSLDGMNLEVHPIEPLQTYKAGEYEVKAFVSDHDPEVGSLIYAIRQGRATVLYAVDSNQFSEEVWQGFRDHQLRFDVVIMDHTYGAGIIGDGRHLNANQFYEHMRRLRSENLLTDNSRIFATHISHEGNPVHEELAEYAKKHGYEIAYDGLVIASSI
jgi:phosphoribosyl 1,2-cyclic phosphate phosphodiesterase